MMFDWSHAWSVLPVLAPALVVTLQATAAGMAIALSAGLLLALARRAPSRLLA